MRRSRSKVAKRQRGKQTLRGPICSRSCLLIDECLRPCHTFDLCFHFIKYLTSASLAWYEDRLWLAFGWAFAFGPFVESRVWYDVHRCWNGALASVLSKFKRECASCLSTPRTHPFHKTPEYPDIEFSTAEVHWERTLISLLGPPSQY